MRTSVICSALMALVCFSSTGCSTTSSWMPHWAWWKKEEAIGKETALAQAAPKLPSQIAGQPNGLSAPTVSYPGTPVASQNPVQYGAQPASAYAPTGQAAYSTTQAGPYNPAADGQNSTPAAAGAYPATASPYNAAAAPYSAQTPYPSTAPYTGANMPAASGAYPSTAPGQSGGSAYPSSGYPQGAVGQPQSAMTPDTGARYAAGSPYDATNTNPAAPAAGYTLQPGQPIVTADSRNAYPGATQATAPVAENAAQPSSFRPGGTSDYQPIQPTSSTTTSPEGTTVIPAGGESVVPQSTYPVHPASAQSDPGGRYSVYQAGGQVPAQPQEPHRFQR